jgi:hypothetical protein
MIGFQHCIVVAAGANLELGTEARRLGLEVSVLQTHIQGKLFFPDGLAFLIGILSSKSIDRATWPSNREFLDFAMLVNCFSSPLRGKCIYLRLVFTGPMWFQVFALVE